VQPLDPETCYRALVSRDARFDGRFFATVHSTGIYCRPICPAPKPKRRNVDFVPSAAAAEARGFRACLRCRPDAAPGSPDWVGSSALLGRALRRIHDGALDGSLGGAHGGGSVEALAGGLGISARHLTRLFQAELGATPLEVARTLRAHNAWRLIEASDLPMTEVAFAAGYGSVRSFNAEVRARFGATPLELRRRRGRGATTGGDGLRLRLAYRPPFSWRATLEHLALRAVSGLEHVEGETYSRAIRQEGHRGRIEVSRAEEADALWLRVELPVTRGLAGLVERARDLFDLRADPERIASDLRRAKELRPVLRRWPGLRLVGGWDGFEVAVRAVVGQQVSLRGATTLLGRLVESCGDPLEPPGGELRRLFPTPEQLLEGDLSGVGMPGARREALRALARAVVEDELDLAPGADPEETRAALLALPGVGPWTADYVLMRGLRDPDAFPSGDLVLRKALATRGETITARELERRSQAWRPWRAYAAMGLWKTMSEGRA